MRAQSSKLLGTKRRRLFGRENVAVRIQLPARLDAPLTQFFKSQAPSYRWYSFWRGCGRMQRFPSHRGVDIAAKTERSRLGGLPGWRFLLLRPLQGFIIRLIAFLPGSNAYRDRLAHALE